jgi:hypothetical protein
VLNIPELGSRKFRAAALAAIAALIGFKWGFTTEQIAIVVAPLTAYVAAQGLADFGKEKAKP